MSWVIVASYAPEQVVVFKTRTIAAAHIFAFAPPVGFAGQWSYDRLTWILHVGPDMLNQHLLSTKKRGAPGIVVNRRCRSLRRTSNVSETERKMLKSKESFGRRKSE
jgi:hypothetical protein